MNPRLCPFELLRRAATLLAALFLLAAPLAQAAPSTPTTDFTDNGDGTATHKTTGLTWKRCAEGQSWSGSTCTGTGASYTWAQATALTSTFTGKSDWRLPNMRELSSITEVEVFNPAINTTIFPNTSASSFWSASTVANNPDSALPVSFAYGYDDYSWSKVLALSVRLVRGGQSPGLLTTSRPTTDYVDHGDGTVTHTPTALTWKRCAEGQAWSGSTCSGTATTATWAAAAALTGTYAGTSGWRLPTQAQLRSLVDFTLANPSINATIFPNTPASQFWSASSAANLSSLAWFVHFSYGIDVGNWKTDSSYVRLVRGLVLTPASQQVAAGASYTLTAQNGVLSNCTSSNPTVAPHPTIAAGGAKATGNIAVGAAANIQTVITCASTSGINATATVTVASDYADNGDGTVTHKTTGLTWKRCAEGQTWSDSTCTGTAANYVWDQATLLTSTFAGKSDWRLPSIRELSTISEVGTNDPAIDTTIFPNTSSSNFWSASASANSSGFAWDVYFNGGNNYASAKSNNFQVRLVRGGQSLGLLALSRPTTDYADNGDGTVTHTPTALTWKRCAEGQTWSGSTCTGTATTATWAAATALTGTYAGTSGWRLPTQAELRSLVDFTLTDPSINTAVFPNTPASNFWSASSFAGGAGLAWYVDFSNGSDYTYSKLGSLQARLVRGGQPVGTLPTDSDRIFNYLESIYPQYIAPANATTLTEFGYCYRYYSTTESFVATSIGKLYFLGPASGNTVLVLGTVADILTIATEAGF